MSELIIIIIVNRLMGQRITCVLCHSFLRDMTQRVIGIMKKLGAGSPAERETRRKISGELFLVAPAWRRARCRPVRPTRITGRRTRTTKSSKIRWSDARVGDRTKRDTEWRTEARLSCTSCGLRRSLVPYHPVSLCDRHLSPFPASPAHLLATVCSFDSFQSLHRHCHCSAWRWLPK